MPLFPPPGGGSSAGIDYVVPSGLANDLGSTTDVVLNGTATVTSATAGGITRPWRNGQTIVIRGGNTGGATYVGTITAGGGTGSVTVSPAPTATASGLVGFWGTDDVPLWQAAINTAPAGSIVKFKAMFGELLASRVDSCTWTTGSTSITDASITAADAGKMVQGAKGAQSVGIPVNSFVGTVTPGVSFVLVNRAGTPINPTANGTGVNLAIGGLNIAPGVRFLPPDMGPWEYLVNPIRNLGGPTFGIIENTTAPFIVYNLGSKISDPILYSLNQLNNTAAAPTAFQPQIQGALANGPSGNQANGDCYGYEIGKPYMPNAYFGIAAYGGRGRIIHPSIGALRCGIQIDYSHDFVFIEAVNVEPFWTVCEGTWNGTPQAGTFDAYAMVNCLALWTRRADGFHVGALNCFQISSPLYADDSDNALGAQNPTCGTGDVDILVADTAANAVTAIAGLAGTAFFINKLLMGGNPTGVGTAGATAVTTAAGGSVAPCVIVGHWRVRGTIVVNVNNQAGTTIVPGSTMTTPGTSNGTNPG